MKKLLYVIPMAGLIFWSCQVPPQVKELPNKIRDLETRVEELENRVEELEMKVEELSQGGEEKVEMEKKTETGTQKKTTKKKLPPVRKK